MAGGRQREFCENEALDKAMRVFWSKGYVGTSLADLTEGMGINKPSMYATFGNKEQLFIKAANHYLNEYAKPHSRHLETNKPLKQRLQDYLFAVVKGQSLDQQPKGCLVTLSVSESNGGGIPAEATELINQARDYAEGLLTELLKEEKENGDFVHSSDAQALARYIVTIMHGTSSMARGGKNQAELEAIVNLALDSLFS